jgi:hypothetical protein
VQAVLQQTPSAQKPDAQAVPVVHGCPSAAPGVPASAPPVPPPPPPPSETTPVPPCPVTVGRSAAASSGLRRFSEPPPQATTVAAKIAMISHAQIATRGAALGALSIGQPLGVRAGRDKFSSRRHEDVRDVIPTPAFYAGVADESQPDARGAKVRVGATPTPPFKIARGGITLDEP